MIDFLFKNFIFGFFLSIITAISSIKFCSKIFRYFGFFDNPDGLLKVHKTPIVPAGGPGILIALFVASFIANIFYLSSIYFNFFIFLSAFFLLGLLDDLFSISQRKKFLIQALLAFVFLFFVRPNFNFLELFWMLSVINAFNLIDVADGLCAIISICAAIGFFFISILFLAKIWAIFFALVFGSLIGFLIFNFPPASIYLGDSGSTLLGAIFGLAPLCLPWSNKVDELLISSIVLGLPLIEVFFLVLIRTYLRIAPYKGSPHHFYIFLKKKGWGAKKILLFIVSIGCQLSFIGYSIQSGLINQLFLLPFGVLSFFIWTIVVYF